MKRALRRPWKVASRIARATLVRRRGRSDLERWADGESLLAPWDSRTIRLAGLVQPGARVLELGAGRMLLREHLPPGCTYIPSDLVARGPETFVCDLNAATLPALPRVDTVVMSGVLEYVLDVPRLLLHLHEACDQIVASYATAPDRRMRTIARRRAQGWVNDYRADELTAVLVRCGFFPTYQDRWYDQQLFTCKKQYHQRAFVRD